MAIYDHAPCFQGIHVLESLAIPQQMIGDMCNVNMTRKNIFITHLYGTPAVVRVFLQGLKNWSQGLPGVEQSCPLIRFRPLLLYRS